MTLDKERKDREERKEKLFFAAFAPFAFPVVLAAVFLALHLPYLPKSLEDLDSINFALGVRQFDVAHHQPHPPGYPVYIALAKIVHAAVPDEAQALGLLSVVAGALGVLAIGALFVRLEGFTNSIAWAPAAALALTSPLYWFTAARPLSDMPGLAAAVGVQALTLGAATSRGLYVASLCAGLATGLRSQVAWLTVPLLLWRVTLHHRGHEGHRGQTFSVQDSSSVSSVSSVVARFLSVMASFIAGTLLWAVPLILITGGPAAYWHALFDQGAEDLGNIQMLWTRHGARDVADALYYAFAAPWAAWPAAAIVLACVALGIVWSWRHARQALVTLAVAFGPYLVFDVLFQETFTSRYALPLVVPMAYLAAAGLRWAPGRAVWLLALPIVFFDAYVGSTSIAAYARQKAPAFRLLDDMTRAASATGQRPVLAPDRRESFDLRRPILWMGAAMPPIVKQLPAPPQHEWLEAVRYWNAGGRDPLWFLVDPKRRAIDLVQHGSPFEYRWPLPYPVLMNGVRPNDVDWYPVDQPEWYVGEGWALTPEAAGVAQIDGRGPAHGPIEGWINDRTLGGVLMIGGRNFEPAADARLTVAATDRTLIDEALVPGAFLRFVQIPPRRDDSARVGYLRVAVGASASNVAIEQFDASARRVVFGFGVGWHEQEFNPRTGVHWRWLSERGELPFGSPTSSGLALYLKGESPLKYFSRASRLTVRAGDGVVFSEALSSEFSLTIPLPPSAGPIVLETDQVYVPAERGWRRTADRRHLGLRIFKVELRSAS